MVAQHAPVLQTGDRMLDAGASSSMTRPGAITADETTLKHRRNELRNTAITAIGEDAPVGSAKRLDVGATIVNRIVAIARPARGRGDNPQITATRENLRIA